MNPDQPPQNIPIQEETFAPVKKENLFVKFWKTKKTIVIIVVVVILLILVGSTSYFLSVQSAPKTYTLTSKDLDKTINIKGKDTVLVDVKSLPGLVISTEISNPSIIGESQQYDEKTGKFSEKIVAKSKGETDIIVTGHIGCPKGAICLPMGELISKNHIVVE
jgi:hypothetical protein